MTVFNDVREIIGWHTGLWLKTPGHLLRELFWLADDRRWDRRLNIDTCGKIRKRAGGGANKDARIYGALPYHEAFEMMRFLKPGTDDVAIDVGCGKGRVTAVFSLERVKEVIGIELEADWAEAAHRNCAALERRKSPVRIIRGDAAHHAFSNETIIFMLDPFGWKTFREVLVNLKRSLEKNPRVLRIAYYGPYADYLDAKPWLEPQGEIGKTEIKVWKAA